MPIYEYKCEKCGNKHEFLQRSINSEEEVTCPNCNSADNKKLFSSFSASVSNASGFSSSCSDGSCGIPAQGSCSTGMCGLN